MRISPSIASSDLLYVAKEIDYIDKYFDNIHIDIEDGVALAGISFGMKLAKKICTYSKSKEKSMHIEVLNPLDYLDDVKICNCDVVFVQVSHLEKPIEILDAYKKAGIKVAVNLCDEDLNRKDLQELIDYGDKILIDTTSHWDPKQDYLPEMEKFALELADKKKIYIDGCVTYDTYLRLKDSNIDCAVLGRAIFQDEEKAIKQYC